MDAIARYTRCPGEPGNEDDRKSMQRDHPLNHALLPPSGKLAGFGLMLNSPRWMHQLSGLGRNRLSAASIPANSRRLLESIAELEAGKGTERELIE